jgi:hypothetical protein
VLKAQIKRRPAMKKISTRAAAQSRNISQQKLTIGLDLGDRNSWYLRGGWSRADTTGAARGPLSIADKSEKTAVTLASHG